MAGRPQGREKRVGGSGNVYKRGDGMGLGGPVGNGGGIGGGVGNGGSGRGSFGTGSGGMGGIGIFALLAALLGGKNKKSGCLTIILIIIVVIVLARCFFNKVGNSSYDDALYNQQAQESYDDYYNSNQSAVTETQPSYDYSYADNVDWASQYSLAQDSSAAMSNNSGSLNTSVSSGARTKYTQLKGNGQDTATVMVYMCGTDLESKNGAATADLQEMLYSNLSDKVNLVVYTGGCKQWKNNVVKSGKNQIYKVTSNGLQCLVDNAGNGAMTDPKTLSSFIKWAAGNFPADRYELIFWDHGAGSVNGYGYDETQRFASSMKLEQIKSALEEGGVKFDIVGFDACLMATLETGLMLDNYADYMVASEETEPSYGWYYTDWLTKLSQNTSIPTLELAQNIADTYYNANARYSAYSGITLSVVDLAELAHTVPDELKAFSSSITELVENDNYKAVSSARSNTKEFAESSKIDQIDIVDFAQNIGTKEAKALADKILDAVKYNRTSSNMSRAYGLSVYFPYRSLKDVAGITNTYDDIGFDSEYAKCIQTFASQQTSGQVYGGGGAGNAYESIFGSFGMGSGSSGSTSVPNTMSSDMLSELLMQMMSGGFSDRAALDRSVTYTVNNSLDVSKLNWTTNSSGKKILPLTDSDWELIDTAYLNVIYDDGTGYIDLGMDAIYDWDDEGYLIGEYDNTWLAINNQPVAYYTLTNETTVDGYRITGYIPAMINGERANIQVLFSNECPDGMITGYQRFYVDGETDTQAKVMQLQDGDTIDFVCDFYSYEGEFKENYLLGEQMIVDGKLELINVNIGSGAKATYKITDIYNQSYWTSEM